MLNSDTKKLSKWFKYELKCPPFFNIWQYYTLKRYVLLIETNRLACFDPIGVPNKKMNIEYFSIIFLSQIIYPSLKILCNRTRQIPVFHNFDANFCKFLIFGLPEQSRFIVASKTTEGPGFNGTNVSMVKQLEYHVSHNFVQKVTP